MLLKIFVPIFYLLKKCLVLNFNQNDVMLYGSIYSDGDIERLLGATSSSEAM